jgi:hypothetical protein
MSRSIFHVDHVKNYLILRIPEVSIAINGMRRLVINGMMFKSRCRLEHFTFWIIEKWIIQTNDVSIKYGRTMNGFLDVKVVYGKPSR